MRIERIKDRTSFGILKEYKITHYGSYTRGEFKNQRIEIFNADSQKQKLFYVSDKNLLTWIKSKLIYFQNGIKRIAQSQRDISTKTDI